MLLSLCTHLPQNIFNGTRMMLSLYLPVLSYSNNVPPSKISKVRQPYLIVAPVVLFSVAHICAQSKTPPQSPEDGHIYYILLIRIALCHISKNLPLHCLFTMLWTFVSVFYVKTSRDVVTVLLIFAKYLSLYLHIFTCTHRGTHTQAHMYNQHTRGMATTRHRSLVERGRRKALYTQKKNTKKKEVRKNPIITNLKNRFEHIELPAKLLDYLLRSNKSNINQWSGSLSV